MSLRGEGREHEVRAVVPVHLRRPVLGVRPEVGGGPERRERPVPRLEVAAPVRVEPGRGAAPDVLVRAAEQPVASLLGDGQDERVADLDLVEAHEVSWFSGLKGLSSSGEVEFSRGQVQVRSRAAGRARPRTSTEVHAGSARGTSVASSSMLTGSSILTCGAHGFQAYAPPAPTRAELSGVTFGSRPR